MGITQADIMISANLFSGGHSSFRCGSGWSILSIVPQKSKVVVSFSMLFPYRAKSVHVVLFVIFWENAPEGAVSRWLLYLFEICALYRIYGHIIHRHCGSGIVSDLAIARVVGLLDV